MRVMSIFFAFLLVMGISLSGSALVGSIPAIAQDDPQGEMPGGEMTDEATDGSGAETDAPDESTEGEMPGGDMPDDAAK